MTDTIESLRAELAAEREAHRRLREAAELAFAEDVHPDSVVAMERFEALRAALAPAEAGTHGEGPLATCIVAKWKDAPWCPLDGGPHQMVIVGGVSRCEKCTEVAGAARAQRAS